MLGKTNRNTSTTVCCRYFRKKKKKKKELGKIKDNPINTHQQCIKREKQHSNKYVKHLKVRNRDS